MDNFALDAPGWTNAIVYACDLSEQEIALRNKFVKEYLKDRNHVNAALRCGFCATNAAMYGSNLMQDSYVQTKIANETLPTAASDTEDDIREARRKQVEEGLLRAAFDVGPGSSHSARVAALAKLSNIYGMDGVKETKNTTEHIGGVMVVPPIQNASDWEKQAISAQEKLVHDTEKDVD